MKGYIYLHDDCNKECVTINVEYITSVANNSYGRAVVRTVDGCKFYVHETQFEVEQKIEAALQNSRYSDNNAGYSVDRREPNEVITCENCANYKDLDEFNWFCTVHQCRVARSDSCECGTRKDQSIK